MESRCAFFIADGSSTGALTEDESEDIDKESVADFVESATDGRDVPSESAGESDNESCATDSESILVTSRA